MGACSEFFTPTKRAFKGLAIVFFIYGVAFLLMVLIISQLTLVHLKNDNDPDAANIRTRRDEFVDIYTPIGIAFVIMSVISYFLMIKYKDVEGISAEEVFNKSY